MLTKERKSIEGITHVESRNSLDGSFYAQNTAENINRRVSYAK